ncbi:MAG: hypothetical protein ACFCUH_00730 [Flavobacteriales bacterium]|jgi:hypothetical protein
MSDRKFPIYCESISGGSLYCIESDTLMTEYQRIGSKYLVHHLVARILPERVLISDMVENADGRWPRISAVDYRERVENWERTLIRLGAG